ncbi:hypothetical protein HYU06_06310 [Candidatus Woesearchaeota archaeon]|nr:hypothetical protein [Candidatus Woesearchaeota archaeon]
MEELKEFSKKDIEKIRKEKQREEAEKQRQEHLERERNLAEHKHSQKQKKKKTLIIAGSILAVIILAISVYAAVRALTPGTWDNFAKCLNEKGAVMYGAISWCKYTQEQAGMFGKSFKYLNYRDHTELPGIKKTPTWVIDGKWYENVQSFQTLAAATGCRYDQ